MQPVLIFYQLSHGQDPDWILGDCVGIALPTFLIYDWSRKMGLHVTRMVKYQIPSAAAQ